MTLQAIHPSDFLGMVDHEKGLVDRKMFSDQEIFELEMEKIFARAWNFMAHESQIPNPGDFFMTYIGLDRVIVVRDKQGRPQVLLNTCRHRGNAVCRAEEGHATSFMCTYHGWTYDLQGKLVGVPGFKDYYHEDLNRDEWGLVPAAKVASYKGFVFANLDPEAPDLDEFLGDVGRMAIDLLAERGEDVVVVGGIQKYIIGCNWKFAVDNVWDYYHGVTHQSAFMAGWRRPITAGKLPPDPASGAQISVLGEYGHALGGPQYNEYRGAQSQQGGLAQEWRERPEAKRALGKVGLKVGGHPHIFPNFWIAWPGLGQVSMRMPKSPTSTEIWWFTFVDKTKPDSHHAQLQNAIHTFGPAGLLEQEDGENWDQSTRGTHGTATRRYPLNYALNRGRGDVIEDELGPPRIETIGVTEHSQLWHYRAWAEWMAADGWVDLRRNHSQPRGMLEAPVGV